MTSTRYQARNYFTCLLIVVTSSLEIDHLHAYSLGLKDHGPTVHPLGQWPCPTSSVPQLNQQRCLPGVCPGTPESNVHVSPIPTSVLSLYHKHLEESQSLYQCWSKPTRAENLVCLRISNSVQAWPANKMMKCVRGDQYPGHQPTCKHALTTMCSPPVSPVTPTTPTSHDCPLVDPQGDPPHAKHRRTGNSV